ncbi:MAG: TlpA disulfide reductase family protein [Gelidibacter sp.]
MKYFALPTLLFIGLLTAVPNAQSQNSSKIEVKKSSEREQQQQWSDSMDIQNKTHIQTRQQLHGTKLAELTLEDIHGNKYTLDNLKDQVVVINFWFIHCKPCIEEIPDLNNLKSEFQKENVKFIAVALDGKVALETFLEKTKFDFIIIPNGNTFTNSLGIPHYPFHVIIDKTGKLHYISDALSLNMLKRLKRKIKKFIK